MVNILAWNVRGLNAPKKQKEVRLLCNEHNISLVGLLETKIKVSQIDNMINNMLDGLQDITNLEQHQNGRICIVWRQDSYHVIVVTKSV